MDDQDKTNEQLLDELHALRKRVAALTGTEEELRRYRDNLEELLKQRTSELESARQRLDAEIADRERAEQAHSEGEEKFSIAFKHAPVMAAITVVEDGTYLDVNNKFLEVLGMDIEQVLGRTSIEVGWLKADDRKHLIEILNREGKVSGVEVTCYSSNGSPIDCLYYCNLVNIGGIVRLLTMLLDVTKRNRAEEALRESEETFRAMFELATVGMAQGEPYTGRLERVNRRYCEITGYSAEELIGRTFPEITHPEDQQRQWECFQAVVKGEAPAFHMEKRYVRKDGAVAWVNVNGTVLRDLSGKPLRSMAVIEDITERKISEESLRESERRHRVLFEGSPLGILAADIETGRFAFGNPSICQMLSYTEKELLCLGMENIFPKADLDMVMSEFESMVRGKKKLSSSIPCLRKDGTLLYVDIAGTLTTLQGREYVVGFFADVTERKRAEEQREESEKSYRLLVKNIPAVVFKGYPDGSAEFFDDNIKHVLGYSLEDFHSQKLKWMELVHPEDLVSAKATFLQALRKDREYVREYRVKKRDGEYAWVQDRSQIVCHENGRIDYISGVLFDVSERKRSEEEKEKLQEQFNQAQKMEAIGRLAGGVAHDFNNMLSVILGYTELALQRLQPVDQLYRNLTAVQRAANRSADLTRQLLASSRKQTISPRVVNLNEQTRAMERLLTRIIGEDIDLTFNLSPELWPVYMDPVQVDQIVANLAVNSRDAMPTGGKLTVETTNTTLDAEFCKRHAGIAPGDFVVVTVSDTGCGMDRETLDHAFEPFFTTKPEGKGTGLGLAMVYGVVKQNNGFVDICTDLGQGTTVKSYIPRYVGHEAETSAPSREGQPEGGWETILLVEDESQIRELAKTILETLGYNVLVAKSPGDAIVLCEKNPSGIHLLLTDIVMPSMNGKELEKKIRAMMPGIRTIFMSGYPDDIIARHGVLEEAVHFLPKPFSVRSLSEKVREVLDG